jgi:hypothetical protein
VKEISKTRKLYVALIIIVSILIFYAAGIVTNFFANPIFSMFFIVSNETAHNIAIYVALVGAAAVAIIGSTVILIKKRKTTKPQLPHKQIISSFKTTNKTPIANNPLNMIQGTKEYKNNETKQETTQITEQPPIQKTTPPIIDQNTTNNQKTATNKSPNEKITCPNCKKQFSTPSYMLDNSSSTPKLILLCPYCKQDIYSKSRSVEEDDSFVKHVDELHKIFGNKSQS